MAIKFTPEGAADARQALAPLLATAEPMALSGTNTRKLVINLGQQLNGLSAEDRALIESMHGVVRFDFGALTRCEQAAELLHALTTDRQRLDAQASDAQVPAALVNSAVAQRATLLKVLDYHLATLPEAVTELASIREGSGYSDLATDLQRLADLADTHAALLADDRFLGDGVTQARALAKDIFGHLSVGESDEKGRLRDEQGRVIAILHAAYTELAAAARFALRGTSIADTFASLRSIARR